MVFLPLSERATALSTIKAGRRTPVLRVEDSKAEQPSSANVHGVEL